MEGKVECGGKEGKEGGWEESVELERRVTSVGRRWEGDRDVDGPAT